MNTFMIFLPLFVIVASTLFEIPFVLFIFGASLFFSAKAYITDTMPKNDSIGAGLVAICALACAAILIMDRDKPMDGEVAFVLFTCVLAFCDIMFKKWLK